MPLVGRKDGLYFTKSPCQVCKAKIARGEAGQSTSCRTRTAPPCVGALFRRISHRVSTKYKLVAHLLLISQSSCATCIRPAAAVPWREPPLAQQACRYAPGSHEYSAHSASMDRAGRPGIAPRARPRHTKLTRVTDLAPACHRWAHLRQLCEVF
jgi:hypothetical protein